MSDLPRTSEKPDQADERPLVKQHEEHESVRQARVFDAVLTLSKPISHVAGLAIGLVGIATIVGWACLRGYLRGVGAPWAIWLIDPAQYVTQALGPLLALLVVSVLSFDMYVDSPPFDDTKRIKFSLKVALVGAAILAMHFSLDKWIFETYRSHWKFVAYAVFLFAGMAFLSAYTKIVVELINSPRSTIKMNLVYMAVIIVGGGSLTEWYALAGTNDVQDSKLNFVEVEGMSCRWRLVRPLSRERVLLIDDVDSSAFRIVSVDDLNSIRSSKGSGCPPNAKP